MTAGWRTPRLLLCATYFAVTIGRIVDGDTVDATIKIYPNQTAQVRIRVLGVDTPEKKAATMEAAQRATAFTQDWLTKPGEAVTVHACRFDTLSRLLWRMCRGTAGCLDEALIGAGHGVAR